MHTHTGSGVTDNPAGDSIMFTKTALAVALVISVALKRVLLGPSTAATPANDVFVNGNTSLGSRSDIRSTLARDFRRRVMQSVAGGGRSSGRLPLCDRSELIFADGILIHLTHQGDGHARISPQRLIPWMLAALVIGVLTNAATAGSFTRDARRATFSFSRSSRSQENAGSVPARTQRSVG